MPVGLKPSRRVEGSDSALKRSAGSGAALVELSSKGSNVVFAPGRAASAPAVARLMTSSDVVTTSFCSMSSWRSPKMPMWRVGGADMLERTSRPRSRSPITLPGS